MAIINTNKNKKGRVGIIAILLIVILYIVGSLIWFQFTKNKGMSTDYPYTVEHTAIGWYKLWLKDDHTTVYCFKDIKLLDVINKAKAENKKIEVYYQDYLFKGTFCTSGNDKISTTVVTNIEVVR
jgi:hypothetical protein